MPAICRDRERHCHDRLEDTRKLFLVQIEAMEKAVALAEKNLTQKIYEMNGIRDQMDARADTFVEQSYYDVQHKSLADRIDSLIKRLDGIDKWQAKQDGKNSFSNLIAVAAIIISILTTLFPILHIMMPR